MIPTPQPNNRPTSGRYANRPKPSSALPLGLKFTAKRRADFSNEEFYRDDESMEASSKASAPSLSKAIMKKATGTYASSEMNAVLNSIPPVIDEAQSCPPQINNERRSSTIAAALSGYKNTEPFNADALENRSAKKGPVTEIFNEIDGVFQGVHIEDRWKTCTQMANNGEVIHLDKKSDAAKKTLVGASEPEDMISPITGLRMMDFGTWAEDRKKAAIAANAKIQSPQCEDDPLIAKMKVVMASRGAKGLIGLARLFRILDIDESNTLSFEEFRKGMKEMALDLGETELLQLFKKFDSRNCKVSVKSVKGAISYDTFIKVIAGSLNKRRKALVHRAFDVLDKDGSGVITVEDMALAYNVSLHPDYSSGKKSKEEILIALLEVFDGDGANDRVVTREEFEHYYSAIGASIDNDDYFELMIRNAWHIPGGEGAAANSANRRVLVTRLDGTQYVEEIKNDLGLSGKDSAGIMARLKAQGVDAAAVSSSGSAGEVDNKPQSGQQKVQFQPKVAHIPNKKVGPAPLVTPGIKLLIAKIKKEMKSRESFGFIGMQRTFRNAVDGNKSLNQLEFRKAMKELALDLSDADFRFLFEYFDADRTGNINFEEFVQGVRDPMSERRLNLVKQIFCGLDSSGRGVVDALQLSSKFDPHRHPDVIAGMKKPDQILREFFDTFDVGGVQEGHVTMDEFVNYYANISTFIDDDEYFDCMVRNVWQVLTSQPRTADVGKAPVIQSGVGSAKMSLIRPSTSNGVRQPIATDHSAPSISPVIVSANPGIKMLVDKIKKQLKSRGSFGFIGMQRVFKIIDDDGNKSLDKLEFRKAMRELALDLSDADLRFLFEFFDTDRSGSIDFEEFIQGVRDPMSERRSDLVKQAFNILDKDNSGFITVEDIVLSYNSSMHPEVMSKKKTPTQVLREFLDTFDIGGIKDGVVSVEEFTNYYANISASIDSDEYFDFMIRNAWQLAGNNSGLRVMVTSSNGLERVVTLENSSGLKPGDVLGVLKILQKQGVTDVVKLNGKPVVESTKAPPIVLKTLLDKVRSQLLSRGPAGVIELQRKFIDMDKDGDKTLSKEEFKEAMISSKLAFTDAQLDVLFKYFDSDQSGSIEYKELLDGLRGALSPKLLVAVHQAFDQIDKKKENIVDPQDIITSYDVGLHPDVLRGRRTESEVMKEFLDTFDVGGTHSGKVTRDEFVQYYSNISFSVNDADYMEFIIRSTWHVDDGMNAMGTLADRFSNPRNSIASRIRDAQSFSGTGGRVRNDNQIDTSTAPSGGLLRPFSSTGIRRVSGSASPALSSMPSSARQDEQQPAMNKFARPKSAGTGTGASRGIFQQKNSHMSTPSSVDKEGLQIGEISCEDDVKEELQAMQLKAVKCYSSQNYEEAENIFKEILAVLQTVYPVDHPECAKAENSVLMVQRRKAAAQKRVNKK